MSDIDEYSVDSSSDSENESIISKKVKSNKKIENHLEEEEKEELPTDDLEDVVDDVDDEEIYDDEDVDEDLDDDDDQDDDDDDELDNYNMEGGADGNEEKKNKKNKEKVSKNKPKIAETSLPNPILYNTDDDDDDDDENEQYLQKFDNEINKNYILDFHPECSIHNYDEISILTHIVKDNNNIIIDDLHKTLPFLTKYEKARVLGQRAKQIGSGAKAFVKVPENVIDGYIIAEFELQQKRIPFIIRRPIPGGGSEYWNLRDLELIHF